MTKKYWVDKGQMEYMVITDSFDTVTGNFYVAIKGRFETESEAQEYANELNDWHDELELERVEDKEN